MEKINLLNNNLNIKTIIENNRQVFQKGQIIEVLVLNNTPTGVVLKINNSVLHAKTDFRFPVNTPLILTVVGQTEGQTILSLNKHINFYNLDISTITQELGLEDSPEIRLIIDKLIENKEPITKENINQLKFLISGLPLETGDALNILMDPSLYLAIFAFLNKDSSFSLLLKEKEKETQEEPYLEISILYQSQKLGLIFANVFWQEKVNIRLTCSHPDTYQSIINDLGLLKQKIGSIVNGQVEITLYLDRNLAEKMEKERENRKPLLMGIDIRI
ncbi:MAG: hypothetical protein GXW85_06705 [Clostridia bacterium]|nr:hypothetical protein [Clostridia bacterium]